MFGAERQIRLRPSYFPFTEPSVEVDVSCFKCGGKGCNVCKKTGWIEILGAGMVHPQVLEMSGVDSEDIQVSPLVLVKNVLPCFVMVSTTFVVSTKGMFVSQNSLNKV